LCAGLIGAVLAGRIIQKVLYGIHAVDLNVMLTVACLFLAAAIVAAFLPAMRAASADPVDALRSE